MSIKALREALAAPDNWFARATWTPADFDDAGYSAAPRAYIAAACTAAPALLARCDALAEALKNVRAELRGGGSYRMAERVDAIIESAIAPQESDK
jgi:hypothetical protein